MSPRAAIATATLRWALAIAGGFTVMAVFLFAFIYWQTNLLERSRVDTLVSRQAARIAATPGQAAGLLRAWLKQDAHGDEYAALFGPDGARLEGNLLTVPALLPADGLVHDAIAVPVARDQDADRKEQVRGVAQHLSDGSLLVVAHDVDQLTAVQAVILRGLGLALLPALALSLAGGLLLAWRAQRRIAGVHAAIRRIMAGQLHERLPVRGTAGEMDRLAEAVNDMLARIEALVDELGHVGDSIAHDLRTPLTRLRTRLERARDQTVTPADFAAATDDAIASVDQALAVVAAVLRIGAIEHGHRTAAFAPVALDEVLRDAAELYEPIAEEKDVHLRLRLDPAAPVRGDRDLLLEAVSNLVDNAIKFAPAGTDVVLALTGGPGGPRIGVTDRGPGIPPMERVRVLQRFYRADRSRGAGGHGLGLSLVGAVVALHGFRLRIDGDGFCLVEILCAGEMPGAVQG